MEDQVIRHNFLLCFQEKRAAQDFVLEANQYNNVIRVLNMMLDVCCIKFDVIVIKQIMLICFSFYKKSDTETSSSRAV
jgi:hypothetical protein